MGTQLTPCKPAIERLPDLVEELRYMAAPASTDAESPASAEIAGLREAAGRLADVLEPALPGMASPTSVRPRLQALLDARDALDADYRRLADYRARPMITESGLLYTALGIYSDISSALQAVPSADAVDAIRQELDPLLDAITRAELLDDEAERAGCADARAIIAEKVRAAEARVRAAIQPWRRPSTMASLSHVLYWRGRSYLLDA